MDAQPLPLDAERQTLDVAPAYFGRDEKTDRIKFNLKADCHNKRQSAFHLTIFFHNHRSAFQFQQQRDQQPCRSRDDEHER